MEAFCTTEPSKSHHNPFCSGPRSQAVARSWVVGLVVSENWLASWVCFRLGLRSFNERRKATWMHEGVFIEIFLHQVAPMNKREAAALLWRVLTHTSRMCFRVCGFSLEKENECMRGVFMGRAQKFKGKRVAPTTEKVSKGIEKKTRVG